MTVADSNPHTYSTLRSVNDQCQRPDLPGSVLALALSDLVRQKNRLIAVITASEQSAYVLEEELRFFLGDELPVTHFADTETLPYDPFSPHQEILSNRLAALYRLPQQSRGVLVLTATALLERMPVPSWVEGHALIIKTNDLIDFISFRQRLVAAGYQSVPEVKTQGEFAVRGALIDLFPMGSDTPYRLDLFDDEVEAIRTFDPDTQRSIQKIESVHLLPAREFPVDQYGIETFRQRYRKYFPGDPVRSKIYNSVSEGRLPAGIEAWAPLFFEEEGTALLSDYLPEDAIVVPLTDLSETLDSQWSRIRERYDRYVGNLERPLMRPEDLYWNPKTVLSRLKNTKMATVQSTTDKFISEQIPAGKEAVSHWLKEHDDHRILFVAESPGRRDAMIDWLRAHGILPRLHDGWQAFLEDRNRYGIAIGPLQKSFSLEKIQLGVIAEAQVFGITAPTRAQRKQVRRGNPEAVFRNLKDLAAGAPVVHVKHGVGRYIGLQRLNAGGQENEYLVLEYAGGDKLYVPIASLNLIHRYTAGTEPQDPPLHQLGSDRWEKSRQRAQKRVVDIAAELLQIHARRMSRTRKGVKVRESDYQRFCEDFPFETTTDQQNAIDAVLTDMEQAHPMDRVVCGDVGFGKTEVALRAAFVTAMAGRQVCVLAPTTLLVQQHEKNFRDRFSDWPVKIASLSRLRTEKNQTGLAGELAKGLIDIVIGTHRLLQNDIQFQNLGLLIIDEEHRFGVRQKEKLKNMRAEVDLLTLTATPIPRTLNMSLAGLRDLSIISTPPTDRLSIRTFVSEWDSLQLQEACLRELKRGGQIYVIHNEVHDIDHFAQRMEELIPEARIRVAHGQMRPRELEQVMLDFYHGHFDILVCTTIIESGIDVPSANTILIDRADRFGLAQLHQLRGRVGRSHRQAYAYLFVPSKRALTTDARRRLDAIEKLDHLGAGFALATQDLEIRGAGELLGGSQSGQIDEIGFTLYSQMLNEAVRAIRNGTLPDSPFTTNNAECEVDLGFSALIPESYVPDPHTRLVLYKRIAETSALQQLDELELEMVDRFGELPDQVRCLFAAAAIRQAARPLGFSKVRSEKTDVSLEFGSCIRVEPEQLIALIQEDPRNYRLEGQKRLHVKTVPTDIPARTEFLLVLLEKLKGETGVSATCS